MTSLIKNAYSYQHNGASADFKNMSNLSVLEETIQNYLHNDENYTEWIESSKFRETDNIDKRVKN